MSKNILSRFQNLQHVSNFMDIFKSEEELITKSVVSRRPSGEYFAILNSNILLLGWSLPSDVIDENIPTADKLLLLVAKGPYSWDVTYSIENVDNDNTSDVEAQNKAISLVENSKNSVQFVVVCKGLNKTFAGRPVYQAFAQYTYVSKEEANVLKMDEGVFQVIKDAVEKKDIFVRVCAVKDTDVDTTTLEKQLFDSFVEIKKDNFVNGLVYGIVYEPLQKDTHGDWTTAEEIEKMANAFLPSALRNGTWTNKNHTEKIEKSDVEIAQSYIAPCDFNFPNGQKVIKGSWVLVSKVNSEELKKDIESGEITGYSLEGVGKRLSVELKDI